MLVHRLRKAALVPTLPGSFRVQLCAWVWAPHLFLRGYSPGAHPDPPGSPPRAPLLCLHGPQGDISGSAFRVARAAPRDRLMFPKLAGPHCGKIQAKPGEHVSGTVKGHPGMEGGGHGLFQLEDSGILRSSDPLAGPTAT